MAKFTITAQMKLAPPTNVAAVVRTIKSQLKGVTVPVTVTVNNQAVTKLKSLQKAVQGAGRSAQKSANSLEAFGKEAALAIRRFGAFNIVTGLFRRLTSAISQGISEAIEFERELIRIAQVADTSVRGVGNLANEVTRLSKSFGVNSLELLKASRILKQTGLSASETEKALEALAKSDLAPTFDDIASTAEGSIAIFRQFRKEAKDLENILGSINAVSKNFAVESSDLITAVRRTGGAFAAAGGELNDLIALFTSVRATTRESAESIATGFRTIFTRLQRTRTINFLETLGIDLRDAQGQFVGPLKAIQALSSALKDLPATDPRFAQITEELGGFRQISKVIPLIKQFDTAQQALNVAQAGGTSLADDAAKAQQSLAVQIAKVREEFAELIRTLVGSDTFQSTVKVLLQLASALVKVADALIPVSGLLASLTLPIAAAGFKTFLGNFRSSTGFLGGFNPTRANKGGLIKGFNNGGVVPGVGNTDTVPALLTPGEFVIRKRAVQEYGSDQLQRLNRGGGAGTGVFKPRLTVRSRSNQGDVGRRKQYQSQRIDFLRARVQAGIATPAEVAELKNLEARQSQQEASRAARFSRKLGFGFNLGGAVNALSEQDRRQLLAERANAAGVDFNLRGATRKTSNLSIAGLIETYAKNPKTSRSKFTAGNPPAYPTNILDAILGKAKDVNDGKYKDSIGDIGPKGAIAPGTAGAAVASAKKRSVAKIKSAGTTIIGVPGVGAIFAQQLKTTNTAPIEAKFSDVKVTEAQLKKFLQLKNPAEVGKVDGISAEGAKTRLQAVGGVIGTLRPDIGERLIPTAKERIDRLTGGILRKAGFPADEVNAKQLGKQGASAIAGYMFEGIIAGAQAGVRNKNESGRIDFPKGLNDNAQRLFGSQTGSLKGVALEAKVDRNDLTEASILQKFIKDPLRKNSGGSIPSAQDTVPALLTPGEFVFKKEAVDRIGVSNLRKLNNMQGFNKGGVVGRYQSGGFVGGGGGFDITSLFLLSSVLGGLAETMFKFEGTTKKVVDALVGLAIQVPIFTGLLKSLNTEGGPLANVPGTASNRLTGLRRSSQRSRIQARRFKDVEAQAVQEGAAARLSGNTTAFQLSRDKFNRARGQRRSALLRARQQRADLAKRQRNAQRVSQAAAFGGAIGLAGGAFVSELGSAEIRRDGGDRTFGRNAVVAGGALQGAGTGAAIGSLFGPLGAAVGAAAGGVFGFVTALGAAQDQIEAADFKKSFDKLNDAITSITAGGSIGQNLVAFQKGLETFEQRFSTATGTELEELQGAIKSTRAGFSNFFDRVASGPGVRNFAQFNNIIGQGTLRRFAELNGIPFDELVEKYKEQIRVANEAIVIDRRLIEARRNFNEVTDALIDLRSALQDSSEAARRAVFGLNDIASASSGGALSQSVGAGRFLNRGGQVIDQQAFSRALGGVRQVGGNQGRTLAGQAEIARAITSRLPDVLRNLRDRDPLGAGNRFGDSFADEIRGITGGGPGSKFIEDILIARVKDIIGAEGKDEKIITAINDDLIGTAESIGAGLKDILENISGVSEEITRQTNSIVKLTDERRKAEQRIVGETQKFIDIVQQQANFEESNRRGAFNFNRLRAIDNSRRQAIGAGSNLGVGGLEANLIGAEQNLENLNRQFAELGVSGERLAIARSDEASRIEQLTNQLRFLADASARSAVAIKEFESIRKSREAIAKVATDVAFGSNESVAKLDRAAAGIAALSTNSLDLSQISTGDRQGILGLAQQLGDTRLRAFGLNEQGQVASGREFVARETAEELQRRGTPAQLAKQIANAIATPEEIRLLQEIRDINKVAADAQLALRDQAIRQEQAISQAIITAIDTFSQRLETLLLQSARERVQGQISEQQEIVARANRAQAVGRGLARFAIGGGEGPGGAVSQRQLDAIVAAQPQIKEVNNLSKTAADLDQAAIAIRGIGDLNPAELIASGGLSDATTETLRQTITSLLGRGDAINQTQREDLITFRNALDDITLSGADITSGAAAPKFLALLSQIGNVEKIASDQAQSARRERAGLLGRIREAGVDAPSLEETPAFDALVKQAQGLGGNLNELANQGRDAARELGVLQGRLRDLNTRGPGALGFNSGGLIPGSGSTDTVPAMLTPGEFVVRKSAVEALGVPFLKNLNKKGRVGFQDGGAVGGGGGIISIDSGSLSALTNVMNLFSGAASTLSQSLDNFPREVQHTFSGKLEVIHNGAAVFESLGENFGELVKTEVQAGLNRLIEEKFPEVGPLD